MKTVRCHSCGQVGKGDGEYCEKTWGGKHIWDDQYFPSKKSGSPSVGERTLTINGTSSRPGQWTK